MYSVLPQLALDGNSSQVPLDRALRTPFSRNVSFAVLNSMTCSLSL